MKKPYKISLAVATIGLALMLVNKVSTNSIPFYWTSLGAMMLLYAVSSAIILLATADEKNIDTDGGTYHYFLGFLGLALGLGLLARLLSGVSIMQMPSFRPLFIILIVADTILLGGAMFLRFILLKIYESDRAKLEK